VDHIVENWIAKFINATAFNKDIEPRDTLILLTNNIFLIFKQCEVHAISLLEPINASIHLSFCKSSISIIFNIFVIESGTLLAFISIVLALNVIIYFVFVARLLEFGSLVFHNAI